MKLKQSIRYQIEDFFWPVIVYYAVVVVLHVAASLAWMFTPATIHMSGGLSGFSSLFLFICGLCSFHDNLPMHLQNGVSRKTLYTAWLAVTVAVSALMAIVDTVLATLIGLMNLPIWDYGSANLFFTLFDLDHLSFGETVVNTLVSIPFSFVVLVFAMSLGYLMVVFFYRLPVKLRIVVGVCLGFLFFNSTWGIRMLDEWVGYRISDFVAAYVWPVTDAIEASPFLTMGCWLVASAVIAAVTWLILRRTQVRR